MIISSIDKKTKINQHAASYMEHQVHCQGSSSRTKAVSVGIGIELSVNDRAPEPVFAVVTKRNKKLAAKLKRNSHNILDLRREDTQYKLSKQHYMIIIYNFT